MCNRIIKISCAIALFSLICACSTNEIKPDSELDENQQVGQVQKICYLYDTEDLQGWDEGLFVEDGSWMLGKRQGDDGFLASVGTMSEPDKGAIVYCDVFSSRPYEIYMEDCIFRFYNYTEITADVAVIGAGGKFETFQIDISDIQENSIVKTKNETLTNTANLFSTMISLAEYFQLVAKKGSALGGVGFMYSKIMLILNGVSAASGQDVIANPYVSGALDLGGLMLDLATSKMFPAPPTALGIAGAVLGVIGIYSNLWDTYWDLYNQAIEDVYGKCTASIENIEIAGDAATISVSVTGYEPFGSGYNCGAAVDDSILAPDVNESTKRAAVTENKVYKFVYDGLEYGKEYKARPFLENTDGISLWKSFIGDWVGPLIRYGEVQSFRIAQPSIVGTWVKESFNWDGGSESGEDMDHEVMIFREDGTGVWEVSENNYYENHISSDHYIRYTYDYETGIMEWYYTDPLEDKNTCFIKLEENRFTLHQYEEGHEWYVYKRLK